MIGCFGPKVMVVAVMTGCGICPLFVVRPKGKINASYYIDEVLKPLIHKYLYPGELHKVWIHHDKAPGQKANESAEFMQETTRHLGTRVIFKDDIPVKSPDASPSDFFGFGYLKSKLKHKRVKSLPGLVRAGQRIISLETTKEAFKSWRHRLLLIVSNQGKQIEILKNIHRRSLQEISSNKE